MTRDGIAALALGLAWACQIGVAATGSPVLLIAGGLTAALYFVLQFGRIALVGRFFLLLILGLGGVTLLRGADSGEVLARGAVSGLLMVAFLAALATLRVAAVRSELIRRCGLHLLAQPPGRAYAVLNLGTMLAATVLLFGVINVFGTMVARAGAPEAAARRAMLAVLRGFAMMPVWSPIALPFGLLAVHYPDVDWLGLLPMAMAAVAVIALAGVASDLVENRAAPPSGVVPPEGSASADVARLVALVCALMLGAGGVAALTGWPMIRAVILGVPAAALVWLVVTLPPAGRTMPAIGRHLTEGLNAERSVLAVMAGAGSCGVMIGALLPVEALTAALLAAGPPAWIVPACIVALFMALGQVGFSPTLTFITLAVLLPDPTVLGLAPQTFYATVLGVWGLASIGTPFSVPAMVTGRLMDTTAHAVAYRWSPLFLVTAPLAVAGLFGALAALGLG